MVVCLFVPYGFFSWAKNLSNLVPAGSRLSRMHISETFRQILSIQCSLEFSTPVVVKGYGHLPISPIWVAHGPRHISLKPLDGFSPRFHGNVLICSCAASWSCAYLMCMGLPMVAHLTHMVLSISWNAYLWNCWIFSIRGSIESSCSCAASWAFSHFTHMGLPMC